VYVAAGSAAPVPEQRHQFLGGVVGSYVARGEGAVVTLTCWRWCLDCDLDGMRYVKAPFTIRVHEALPIPAVCACAGRGHVSAVLG
jgi:hypothetical protein